MRSSASASAPASPTGTRSAASPSVSAKHGEVGDHGRRAVGGGLERHQPEALEVRRRHDGQRAGVERGQLGVVDAAQAVADDDELGVEAAGACALRGRR